MVARREVASGGTNDRRLGVAARREVSAFVDWLGFCSSVCCTIVRPKTLRQPKMVPPRASNFGLQASGFTSVCSTTKSLKVDITHLSDPSLQNFYHRCPVLEELAFEGMIDKFPDVERHFRVSSESLKVFSLRLHSDFNYEMYYDVGTGLKKVRVTF